MIFVPAGAVLAAASLAANIIYLFVPLATGFLLVRPAATLGFYAISCDLEVGRLPSFTGALWAYRTNPGRLLYVGFALLALFLVWLRLAQLVFALTFPSAIGFDAQSLLHATLFTGDGQVFLVTTLAMGAVMAAR
jgi:uncharacterized membrane protein